MSKPPRIVKLSTHIELLEIHHGSFSRFGWRRLGVGRDGRPDKAEYGNRADAIAAAHRWLESFMLGKWEQGVEIIDDAPAEAIIGQGKLNLEEGGRKRRRNRGSGYSGGDGFHTIS